jgi:hypothetical protein
MLRNLWTNQYEMKHVTGTGGPILEFRVSSILLRFLKDG